MKNSKQYLINSKVNKELSQMNKEPSKVDKEPFISLFIFPNIMIKLK